MTFQEWADKVFAQAETMQEVDNKVAVKPWRCDGPCGQLMYGIERVKGKNYPTPEHTPTGLFISKDYPHVCHVCWEMYHVVELSSSGYWQRLDATDTKRKKQLGSGGDYLFT
jgi:hypothetical protein